MPVVHPLVAVQRQSTAMAKASHIWCIRASLSRPIRSVRSATDTLPTESRLTDVRRRTGSSSGSRITSLGRLRIVVVHGAINARPSRGIAASRDKTTTGRRPMSGGSHHHSSPRSGLVKTTPQRIEMIEGRPTRRVRRADARHRRGTRDRSVPNDYVRAMLRGRHQ